MLCGMMADENWILDSKRNAEMTVREYFVRSVDLGCRELRSVHLLSHDREFPYTVPGQVHESQGVRIFPLGLDAIPIFRSRTNDDIVNDIDLTIVVFASAGRTAAATFWSPGFLQEHKCHTTPHSARPVAAAIVVVLTSSTTAASH